MEIILSNCRNIGGATIGLVEGKLNIKYAINGTGKSTIARAIELAAGKNSLSELVPFRFLGKPEEAANAPTVSGIDGIGHVAVFNEEYVSQFAFKKDELISNSFEIFIKTSDYDTHMEQIDSLLSEIRVAFQRDESLNEIIKDLTTFIESFGKAASGYSAAGALAKGIGGGNKVENIPPGLEEYSDFIRSEKKVPWLGWQIKGYEFLEISEKCPFCTSEAGTKKEKITKVKEHYDAKAIEHLNNILAVISKLSHYFSSDTNERFSDLSRKADRLSKEEIGYLLQVKEEAITLRDKLSSLKTISFFQLREVDKLIEAIEDYKIDLKFLPHFDSDHTSEVVRGFASMLDSVLEKAGELQREVNLQKKTIEETINGHSEQINSFLLSAGYKYQVTIDFENNEYRLRLRHVDYEKPIENGDQYLSFGERNALSIVLFMYECISRKADFIVLDDPISSFDKNKKYAIIEMLFGKGRPLVNKTVMLLTHDFEPVIDTMYTLRRQYGNKVVASFLEGTDEGIVEKTIEKEDIRTFADICFENIRSSSSDVVKLIHLRRLYEINNNKGLPYELLSSLFHKRRTPCKGEESGFVDLTAEEIQSATEEVCTHLGNFDYDRAIDAVADDACIRSLYSASTSNFEKLELFRILVGESAGGSVLRKYVNETYHIENDYVMQLNPLKFQLVPFFIVEQCDAEMGMR